MCGNIKFILNVDEDILVNTRNKFYISKHASMYCLLYKKCPIIPWKNSIKLQLVSDNYHMRDYHK